MKEYKSVSLKNFFSYGNQEQTLDLSGNGIVNISGSNGLGKTTLCIEAITFAIYGKHREDKIDDCVNRTVKKNCKVSLEFIGDDDEVYKVIRYRKHDTHGNSVYLFKDDKDISCKNAKDTDALIQELIGMPYIAFVNSTLFSSELYSNFFKSKGSERLVVFENILSLKEINAFYSAAKEIIKKIEEKKEDINLAITQKQATVDSISSNISAYTNNAKEKLLKLKEEKEATKLKKEETEKKIKELSSVNVEEERVKLSNKNLSAEYEEQIKTKKLKKKQLLEVDTSIIEKYKNVDFEKNKLKEEKYNKDTEILKLRESGCEAIMSSINATNTQIGSLKKSLKNDEEDLEDQKKNMESIKSSICPFCGQKMNEEETEKKRESTSKKIKILEENISSYNEEIASLEEKLKGDSDGYNKLILEVNEIKKGLDKDFIPNSDLIKEKYENAVKEYERVIKENKEIEELNNTLDQEIEELLNKKNCLSISSYTEEELDNISESIKEQEEIIKECDSKISSIEGSANTVYDKKYIEDLKAKLEEANSELEKENDNMKIINNELIHYQCLANYCSNKSDGFKKFFINEMIPMFNNYINKYLPFFFNDRTVEVELDKNLEENIKVNGEDVTYSSFSKGQKARLELAASFSLFELSRVFFNNQSGLLVVDEMLDGLDDFGIKSAISSLEGFAQDSKVFVVSHNKTVKENMENIIEIKTDDSNFSIIS